MSDKNEETQDDRPKMLDGKSKPEKVLFTNNTRKDYDLYIVEKSADVSVSIENDKPQDHPENNKK